MCPPAYTMIIRMDQMASGANSVPEATTNQITRTRKNVPSASVR